MDLSNTHKPSSTATLNFTKMLTDTLSETCPLLPLLIYRPYTLPLNHSVLSVYTVEFDGWNSTVGVSYFYNGVVQCVIKLNEKKRVPTIYIDVIKPMNVNQ